MDFIDINLNLFLITLYYDNFLPLLVRRDNRLPQQGQFNFLDFILIRHTVHFLNTPNLIADPDKGFVSYKTQIPLQTILLLDFNE